MELVSNAGNFTILVYFNIRLTAYQDHHPWKTSKTRKRRRKIRIERITADWLSNPKKIEINLTEVLRKWQGLIFNLKQCLPVSLSLSKNGNWYYSISIKHVSKLRKRASVHCSAGELGNWCYLNLWTSSNVFKIACYWSIKIHPFIRG